MTTQTEEHTDEWDDGLWEDCPQCGGAAWVSRYDEDPLWYDEDDLFRCETCQGRGWVGVQP